MEEYSFDVQSTSSEKSLTAEMNPLKTAKERLLLGCDRHIFFQTPSPLNFRSLPWWQQPFFQLHPQGMMSTGGNTIFAWPMRSVITWKTGAMRWFAKQAQSCGRRGLASLSIKHSTNYFCCSACPCKRIGRFLRPNAPSSFAERLQWSWGSILCFEGIAGGRSLCSYPRALEHRLKGSPTIFFNHPKF